MACSEGHLLTLRAHRVAGNGDVMPSVVCPEPGCRFHEYVRLDEWTFGAIN
jgi:hypothetical protein